MHSPSRIGLVAGWGRYPFVVAAALRRQGQKVYCVGVRGHADPALAALCDDYLELGLGKFGAGLRYFRRNRVTRATMAGKIHKTVFFRRFHWIAHLPDWRCVRAFAPHFITRTKDCRDDSLLKTVVDEFAKDGIAFARATDFAPELLVRYGTLNGRLSSAQRKDVEFGWSLAKEMGRLDVGQSVAVKGQAVLAVEAIEGTDECIRRVGQLCPQGGFVVVKTAKPQQDMRFDVPTIGLGTLQTLVKAGGSVLAVEAGKTILLDEAEAIAFARRNNITLVALQNGVVSEAA